MSKEQSKRGAWERGAGFFEKLSYSLGVVALLGAAILPLEASSLAGFAISAFAIGVLSGYLKNRAAKKPKTSLAPA